MLLRALACACVLVPAAAFAQAPSNQPSATGQIVGRVLQSDGTPFPGVEVMVLGTRVGAITDADGRFRLTGVAVGPHQVRARSFGFTPQVTRVSINAGATATVHFQMEADAAPVRELPEVEVLGKRRDLGSVNTKHQKTGDELRDMPGIDSYMQAMEHAPGVVVDASGLHVRGSRSDEVKVRVNDIEMTNALSGENVGLANLAVSEVTLHAGNMEAEFGGALSGIIAVNTREGTERFSGELRWDTDRYGDPTKTFNHFDRVTFALGGPTMVRDLTYFMTYEGSFQNLYPHARVTTPQQTLWDFISLGNRQSNQIHTNFKLAYRLNARHKVTLEAIRNRSSYTPYEHMWSRSGFVQVTSDTVHVTGQPDQYRTRYGQWSATPLDSTYKAINMPDHVPTENDRFASLTAVWTNQLSNTAAWTTRISSIAFDHLTSVGRKQPWDYWVSTPEYWDGNTENDLFFATHGDYPVYSERQAATWVVKSDFSSSGIKGHTLKTGFEARYNRVRNLGIQIPNGDNNGLPGAVRSDFLNENPEGAWYAQDRWEFEGMILNAGLRFDFFTPGAQIADRDLPSGRRYKQQLSPRLGIAYPISDKDALSFNYGWTYQTPARNYVFENRGLSATVATRGNPDLEPETNVAYQAAVQHLFTRDVSGQFAVFFRDIYGLITVRDDRDQFGNQITRYVNRDYASARGFEASITKSFSHKFSAEINYTYQIASGVASDPRQAQQFYTGGRLYLPISELPLAWDQRNTLSLQGTVRDPGRWGLRFLWSYGSGRPFTPTFRNDRRADPVLTNSRRLPASATLNVDADRYFKVWNRPVTVFIDARNVLDARNVATLSQGVFPNPFVNQSGDEYLIYYTETGRAGGAYLKDVDGDHVLDWVPVRDPRVFMEGRNVRVGLSLTFGS
ncbi:MAG TPA: TonB-dependent receptor [Candidatus Eisenbacteria bacterium]|nr:TonB-dependent receptor [Candidatus Eisenbacteria bacterium]